MITIERLKQIVEAALFVADEPLSVDKISKLFPESERPSTADLRAVLKDMLTDYSEKSFELKQLASGYTFQVREDFAPYVKNLWEIRPPKYSRALLETLALVAYRQPITRADIEDIRGVSVSSHIVKTLIDREWVKEVGHKEVPGRPALLATTKKFLDYFSLKSLSELPSLQDIQDLEQAELDLVERVKEHVEEPMEPEAEILEEIEA